MSSGKIELDARTVGWGCVATIAGYGAYRMMCMISDLQAKLDKVQHDIHEGNPARTTRRNSNAVDVHIMMEVQQIFKILAGGSSSISFKDLQLKLPEATGVTLEEGDITFAREVMGVYDDHEAINFHKFYQWWSAWSAQAVPERHRGRSDLYTQRFKLASQYKIAQRNKDVEEFSQTFDLKNIVRRMEGKPGSLEYRVKFFLKQGEGVEDELKPISPWHDIPLEAGKAEDGTDLFHMVVEIPKWTREKFEVATGEQYNPIKQDTKNGQLRKYDFYQMFNYGALPQTWEDPAEEHTFPDTPGNFRGDNDPIDCVEIGTKQIASGHIIKVRVVGILAMIDDDETDWKLIVINNDDPLAKKINDVSDIEAEMPGAVEGIVNWFTEYKTRLGEKAPNRFALHGKAASREYALSIISETKQSWLKLMGKQIGGIKRSQSRSQVVVPATHDA